MKTLALIAAGLLALSSLPAQARPDVDRGHEAHEHAHLSLGLGFGVPAYYPFGYDPWFYPYPYSWYAPLPSRRQSNAPVELYAYPESGQSEQQMAQDESECHDWAVGQADYDPSARKRQKQTDLRNYNRAYTACMEARDYRVH